ncbi:MAG: YbhB/YbcL family Raf kinase inhibitor-like protein [Candidatus Pacearchaeota archaeon]
MIIETNFKDNEDIPVKHTCKGKNTSPPFKISEIPENAKSMAIIVIDPDANNFIHWVIYNIPLSGKDITIEENTNLGMQGENSLGKAGYFGPCPPSGKHRYIFSFYILDSILFINNRKKEEINRAMSGHIIENQIITGYFEKNKE